MSIKKWVEGSEHRITYAWEELAANFDGERTGETFYPILLLKLRMLHYSNTRAEGMISIIDSVTFFKNKGSFIIYGSPAK